MDLRYLDDVFVATSGVFTPTMLVSRGHSRRSVRRWLELGDVVRVCGRGFVRHGHPVTVVERAFAARLTWPDSIVCFLTAAVLHGLPLSDDGVTHVLVPSLRRPVQGVRPHFWSVRPTDVLVRGQLVMTDRRTTLSDCLGRMPADDAWAALAWLFTRDLITAHDLESQIGQRRAMYGVVRLRSMTEALARSAVSVPEIELQRLLEENGITGWSGNLVIREAGRVVARADVGFGEGKLAVEYDGRRTHGPGHRRRDQWRTARLHDLGWEVLRVTWVSLHSRRRLLCDTVSALLTTDHPERRRGLAHAWNEGRYADLQALLRLTVDGVVVSGPGLART